MTLTEDEVLRILRIVDGIGFGELRLEFQDLKIHLQKLAPGEVAGAVARREAFSTIPAAERPAPPPASAARPNATEPRMPLAPGHHLVAAPLRGIFYRAPRPGAPAFVETGELVGASATVCLIEVMKLFQSVPAGRGGVIAAVLAEDGAEVAEGQALFAIREP